MAEILCPLTGRIQEIKVKEGQMITEDDELFVIDAMKMETVIYGEPGVIKEICVSVDAQVEVDQVLAIIE